LAQREEAALCNYYSTGLEQVWSRFGTGLEQVWSRLFDYKQKFQFTYMYSLPSLNHAGLMIQPLQRLVKNSLALGKPDHS